MPRTYEPIKQDNVEAQQFTGWDGAAEIMKWIPGIFYVPQGFDHDLRQSTERNLDGKPSKNAPEFLVFPVPGGTDIRIDLETWLVINGENKTYIYNDHDFKEHYQLKGGFESKVMESTKTSRR